MDLLLHPPEDSARHRPDPRGRLTTAGHSAAFRAFARAAKHAGVRFMVIGGTFRDVAVRATTTRDIDVVLIDQLALPAEEMRTAGFTPVPGSSHAWRYTTRGRTVDIEVAAIASSHESGGPFSVAFRHADHATIEGVKVPVPKIEDYVILKLLAAHDEPRRRARDLLDVHFALEAFPHLADGALSVAAIRARLRTLYGIIGEPLKEVTGLFRHVVRQCQSSRR